MNTITIQYPDSTPLPFIVAALMPFGAVVLEDAPALPRVSSSSKRPRAPRQAVEYRELIYTRPDGNGGRETVEMDGVEVAQRIRAMEAQRRRQQGADGRNPGLFRGLTYTGSDDPQERAAEYIKRFCSALSHVPVTYTNGVRA